MRRTLETNTAVVGPEAMENLRLADALRRLAGPEVVHRILETRHLLPFLDERKGGPTVVFVDLFGYDLGQVTEAIGEVRHRFPQAVFGLYLDRGTWQTRRADLPGEWAERLDHYYSLHKVPDDEEFEPIVRQALRDTDWEAQYNVGHEPIRITEPFTSGVLPPDASNASRPLGDRTVFVSYSRDDWEEAVSGLVDRMREGGIQVWVDQGFIVGGDDWMDAIGAALKQCSICLLAVSPTSLQSRYVKMEYRYFFNNDKPIVPVVIRPTAELPPELSGIQFLDFTAETPESHERLHHVLARSAGEAED